MLCARENAGMQALYDPDRLKSPMIRDGEKGSGKFKKVTWDEAFEYIKVKMLHILDEEKIIDLHFYFVQVRVWLSILLNSFMKHLVLQTG